MLSFVNINALKLLCLKTRRALLLIMSMMKYEVFHPKVIFLKESLKIQDSNTFSQILLALYIENLNFVALYQHLIREQKK